MINVKVELKLRCEKVVKISESKLHNSI